MLFHAIISAGSGASKAAICRRCLTVGSLPTHSRNTNLLFNNLRHFSTGQARRADATLIPQQSLPKDTVSSSSTTQNTPNYQGPLTTTFRRLKIFSLASFGLSMTLAPFMFIVESNLPYTARLALASIAIGTSGLSTSLVSWCAKPYVTSLRRLRPEGERGSEVLEMRTTTLALRPRTTTVYDPEFLIETRRPMAKWELAQKMILPPSRLGLDAKDLAGMQETVAETADHNGQVIGRWIVTWGENGEGTCHEAGRVVRYFNVHEELLR